MPVAQATFRVPAGARNRRGAAGRAARFGLALLVAGCAAESAAPRAERGAAIRAAATVGMVADLVRHIGGPRVDVVQILGSGVDPHLYKPTRDDVRALSTAPLVFYCGLLLEGKMGQILHEIAATRPAIAVAERLDRSRLIQPPDAAGHCDPHVWMDVSAWSECAAAVADALIAFDPAGEADYRAREAAYRQELAALHAYGQTVIATIPAEQRILITSHDAFSYFGRAYGLEVRGIQGISTESEAGIQQINQLVDLLVARRVQAVFVESSVPRKNIEALIEGCAARGHTVRIGGELFSDAMGPAGTYEGTYVGMLDHNLTCVARGLGGQAPERGFQQRLSHP